LPSRALENGVTKITGIMAEMWLGTGNEKYCSINLMHS
jgi:hypothetical protein